MQHVEIRTKSSMAALMWLSFGASLPSSCTCLMTLAVPIKYSCAKNPKKLRTEVMGCSKTAFDKPTANSALTGKAFIPRL